MCNCKKTVATKPVNRPTIKPSTNTTTTVRRTIIKRNL